MPDDEELKENPHRPYGCKCQSLHVKVVGDGCDECNPDYMEGWDDEED